MAIYHLSVKPMSRKAGRSATAAAAYRAAERVHDLSTDQVFDYTRKRGVEHAEIVLPTECAKQDINWARDRQALWNVAESAENRKNSRVAREYEIALPHELSKAQRLELVREFAADIANRHGVAVDFAIHAPHRHGDDRNWHAHLMATTRTIEAKGLGAKVAFEWSDGNRRKAGLGAAKEEIKEIRGRWAGLINEKFKEQGLEIRVDHRSLESQGIERIPTTHLGPAVSGMERRGIETEVGKRIELEHQAAAQRRIELAAELGKVEREGLAIQQSILDLSGDLQAAKRERALELKAGQGRDKFAGLTLGTKTIGAERGAFAGLSLSSERTAPAHERLAREASANLHHAVDRFARAWTDAARMREQGLPILEHQKLEFKEAGMALERERSGAKQDLVNAIKHEPATHRAVMALQGNERVAMLVAGIDLEARVRADPGLRAQRLVKEWNGLETQRQRLWGWEHTEARGQVEEQLKTLARELKQDSQLETHLRTRQQSLGLERGSALERVMKEPNIERAMALSVREHERDLGFSR